MVPFGPMMDFRVCVRPTWSGAAKSGTPSPTAGPVLIWPTRAAVKTPSHRVRRMIHRILAWADHGALGNFVMEAFYRTFSGGLRPSVRPPPSGHSIRQILYPHHGYRDGDTVFVVWNDRRAG